MVREPAPALMLNPPVTPDPEANVAEGEAPPMTVIPVNVPAAPLSVAARKTYVPELLTVPELMT
jgi:hypothetical protein